MARGSRDALGLGLFGMLLALCSEVIVLSVDGTLCRKFGRKRMFGCGMHHDAISSSRNKAIVNWGLNWVILAVVVRLRCCPGRVFSLPVLCRLYLNHKAATAGASPIRLGPSSACRCSPCYAAACPIGAFICWATQPTAPAACWGLCRQTAT